MTRPKVTIVIPTHNRRRLMSRTLDTALAQQGVETEVIVVDDGSRDDTSAFLRGHPDPRLRLIRHERARGPAAARNSGIAAATGDWIAFLDDDDLWSPHKLEKQLEAAAAANANVVYAAGIRVDADLRVLNALPARDPATILPALVNHCVIPAVSGVMATSPLIRRTGGFDERLSLMADWDMWLRLIDAGTPGACEQPLVAYVAHSQAMSVNAMEVARHDYRIMAKSHRDLAARVGRPFAGEDFWLWIVWGHRISGRRAATARAYVETAVRFRRPAHLARAAAALVGPPLMDLGGDWGRRIDVPAPSPEWLDELRARVIAPLPSPNGQSAA